MLKCTKTIVGDSKLVKDKLDVFSYIKSGPEVIKNFMLNSAEHELLDADKY